jgi:acetylornithine/N-succinyldiaminopimelate aminotransferase
MARTGKWFAWQHTGAIPDLMTVAKALGNGFPIGACLGRGMAAELLRPGSHASTFGGNPLACRVALSVLEAMASEALPAHAAQAGQRLMTGLSEALRGIQGVLDVRGRGLMIAIELDRPCLDVVTVAVQHRLLVNVTAERIVRLLPPLILDDTEVALAVQGVRNVIVQSNAAQG